jgi:hypothetical protein
MHPHSGTIPEVSIFSRSPKWSSERGSPSPALQPFHVRAMKSLFGFQPIGRLGGRLSIEDRPGLHSIHPLRPQTFLRDGGVGYLVFACAHITFIVHENDRVLEYYLVVNLYPLLYGHNGNSETKIYVQQKCIHLLAVQKNKYPIFSSTRDSKGANCEDFLLCAWTETLLRCGKLLQKGHKTPNAFTVYSIAYRRRRRLYNEQQCTKAQLQR